MKHLCHCAKTVCTLLLLFPLSLALGGCSHTQHVSPTENGLALIILHTNDTHSHIAGINTYGNACFDDAECRGGLSRIATAIRAAKAGNDNVIALDAGDQFQGTLFYSVNKWPMLAELARHMPYDAMTLGNHEFDEGCLELTRFLEVLPFPALAANLKPELVIKSLLHFLCKKETETDFYYHRIENYARLEDGKLIPLDGLGTKIEG